MSDVPVPTVVPVSEPPKHPLYPDLPVLFTYNGMPFHRVPGVTYAHDYRELAAAIGTPREHGMIRFLLKNDLWFVVYFVLKMSNANHPFIIDACHEVEKGPVTDTVDVWSREHLKSTILTIAEPIQKVCRNPEIRICIYSYKLGAAQAFLQLIKQTLESSELLKWAFPDVFWGNPELESPSWGLDKGLTVKRKGVFKEATFEAHGLIDGMPVGKHFDHRVNDDFVTQANSGNAEIQEKVKSSYMMSHYTGAEGGTKRVVGTPYHDNDSISYICGMKDEAGVPYYHVRKKPGREGGTYTGRSVFWSEERHREVMADPKTYRSQVLLDPSPAGNELLDPELLEEVEPQDIPRELMKVMAVDPAGENVDSSRQDSWGLVVIGFQRVSEDGNPRAYILDLVIEKMRHDDALDAVVEMYSRNGRIKKLGVEKVAMSSHEMHVSNALRARKKVVTVKNGGLHILRPGGRSKQERIIDNVQWPLNNGKLCISKAIPRVYIERLKEEMRRFPFWHDDGPDAVAYGYEMAKEFRFGVFSSSEKTPEPKVDKYERSARRRAELARSNGWLGAG